MVMGADLQFLRREHTKSIALYSVIGDKLSSRDIEKFLDIVLNSPELQLKMSRTEPEL